MFVRGNSRFKFGYFLSSASTLLAIGVTLIIVGCWIFFTNGRVGQRLGCKWESRPEIRDEGYMIISSQFRKFSYDDLQNATRCFMEELGSGASGTVYKGILEQEFRSELSVIGRIYQMNPVRIWGFCAEQTHKLLASEFVESGSLDRFLFDSQNLISVL